MRILGPLALMSVVCLLLPLAQVVSAEEMTVLPENSSVLAFFHDGNPYFELALAGWGPKWSWMGVRGRIEAEDGRTIATNRSTVNPSGAKLTWRTVASRPDTRQVRMAITLTSSKTTDLTYAILGVNFGKGVFDKGQVRVILADGTDTTVETPTESDSGK